MGMGKKAAVQSTGPKSVLMCAVPGLLWECVKKNSSFIRTSPGTNAPVMSAEPGNLMALNSYKFNGLVNKNALDVSSEMVDKKEKVLITTRHAQWSRSFRPKSMLVKKGLKKQSKKGLAAIQKTILAGYYRRDLLDVAKLKYAKVMASFKKRKVVVKSRRVTK